MNIVLINHYAGSPELGMEFRPYYMAKHWIEQGHNVVIIASNFHHLRIKQIEFKTKTFETTIDGIPYLFYKTPKYQGNGFKRALNIFSFVKQLTSDARNIAQKYQPDVVIASSTYPADILPAYKIANLSKAKLIYEIHDLWPLTPKELGNMPSWHPFIATLQYFENFAYRKVDAVVSILPHTKEHCVAHGLKPEKWYHVPNGIVLEEWEEAIALPENLQKTFNKIKEENKTIVGYVGSHSFYNILHILVDAARILKDNKNIIFVSIGDGPERPKLIEYSKDLDNIMFLGPVNKKMVPSVLKQMDILFIGLNKSPLFRFGISPNKLFDYMMAGKPIIQAIEAPNDIVKEAECGISVEPENPQAIANAILTLTQKTKEELEKMGENGKNYVLQNNDYKVIANKFLEIIKNC